MGIIKKLASGQALLFVLCTMVAQGVCAQAARIMVVGDSISAGWQHPSYRMPLVNTLKAESCEFDMVGDQSLSTRQFNNTAQYPGQHFPSFPPSFGHPDGAHWAPSLGDDTDHQAFPGIQTDELLNGVDSVLPIASYVSAQQPNYILLQTGSSDLSNAIAKGMRTDAEINQWADDTISDINLIISQSIRAHQRPYSVKILIGNYISDFTTIQSDDSQVIANRAAQLLSRKITAFVESRRDPRVLVVDVASGFNAEQMTHDGLNPNAVGENHIAGAFLSVLRGAGLCAELYPAVSSPYAGSVVNGDSVSIKWRDNGQVLEGWRIYAGATQSGSDAAYYDSGYQTGADRTLTINGLPEDGSNVYVALEYRVNGVADITLSSFISAAPKGTASTPSATSLNLSSRNTSALKAAAADSGSGPILLSPQPSSALGRSATFRWSSNSTRVSQWWLRVGSSPGAADYYSSGRLTNASQRSVTATNLPTNGRSLYVGLHYKTASGSWVEKRYVFRASSSGGSTDNSPSSGSHAVRLSPSAGNVLSGSSQTFNWTGHSGVQQWWFRAGSSPGGSNYFDSGRLTNAGQRSITARNLPTNGSTVHVVLFYKAQSGTWKQIRTTYRAASRSGSNSGGGSADGSGSSSEGAESSAQLTSPGSGATLSGSSQSFSWSGTRDISQWWFRAGSSSGSDNYFNSGRITNAGQKSITARNLPTNGRTVHITLQYKIPSGTWLAKRYTFKAASSGGSGSNDGGSNQDGGGTSNGSNPPALDLNKVRWLHTDVSDWAETARLSSVSVNSSNICLNYNKANSWPRRNIFNADLVANAWVFIWNEGQQSWYGATWEWFRPGQTCKKSSAVDGRHIKQSPYTAASGWRPKSGETLYFMVSGLARTGDRNVRERTKPVKVIWP